MKLDRVGLACVENKFLKLPNIQKYEVVSRTEDGFIASVESFADPPFYDTIITEPDGSKMTVIESLDAA